MFGINPLKGVFFADELNTLKYPDFYFEDENIIYPIKKEIPENVILKRQPGNGGLIATQYVRDTSMHDNWKIYTSGTSFSGGSGCGGWVRSVNSAGTGGPGWYAGKLIDTYAGCGGHDGIKSNQYYFGGAAGNPSGKVYNPGEEGNGGLLILVVYGTLMINLNGKIIANGSKAGNSASTYSGRVYVQPCGNSGGGSINIFLRNMDYINLGNISASGVVASYTTASEDGSVNIDQF